MNRLVNFWEPNHPPRPRDSHPATVSLVWLYYDYNLWTVNREGPFLGRRVIPHKSSHTGTDGDLANAWNSLHCLFHQQMLLKPKDQLPSVKQSSLLCTRHKGRREDPIPNMPSPTSSLSTNCPPEASDVYFFRCVIVMDLIRQAERYLYKAHK